jgi:hypothetical protein
MDEKVDTQRDNMHRQKPAVLAPISLLSLRQERYLFVSLHNIAQEIDLTRDLQSQPIRLPIEQASSPHFL